MISILQPTACVQRDSARPALLWLFGRDVRAVSTAVVGGGIRECRWIVNVEVDDEYHRDPVEHVTELAGEWNLTGPGSGLLTAAPVKKFRSSIDVGTAPCQRRLPGDLHRNRELAVALNAAVSDQR